MLTLTIETDNAAFEDDKRGEIARILEKLVDDIRNGKEPSRLVDYNGNICGKIIWGIWTTKHPPEGRNKLDSDNPPLYNINYKMEGKIWNVAENV